jgi:adenosylhomocysteine nucleosidase
MLAIIGAMDEEVSRLIDLMDVYELKEIAGMKFTCGNMSGTKTVVVRSGIGKVNAAVCTQILASEFHVDSIINTGIAGSLDSDIDIGDIVLSTDALQHDVDAVAFGYPKGQIPRMDTLSFPADKKLAEHAEKCCKAACPDIKVFKGRVVSGDQFIADKAVKDRISADFGGLCTEMEGAAIAQAAYLNNIPYIIIRAISDKADDSASVDYPTFEKKAIENSVKLLSEMVRTMGR